MRGLRAENQGLRLVADLPEPAPGPGEALIRVLLAGIAEPDARVSDGDRRFTGIPGHEFVGIVERLNIPGDAPPALRDKASLKGKRVVASPHVVCGHCDRCRSGLAAHCRARQVIGTAGTVGGSLNGCLAERLCLPIGNLVPLPESVTSDMGVVAVPLSAALHTVHMLRDEESAFVSVLGDNLLSLLTAHVLARTCKSLRALVSNPDHIRVLERWGIKHRTVDEAGRRQDQAVVVDCSGTAAGLKLAMQHVRPRGLIILKSQAACAPFLPGVPFSPTTDPAWNPGVDLTPIISNEIRVHGSRDGSVADAVRAMERGEVDLAGLVGNYFSPAQSMDAIEAARNGTRIKVVINFDDRR